MKNRKGFTLVELLAVIVILAIIMIIAIPSVLGTLETARQKTFVEYVTRVMEAGQNQYLTQLSAGDLPKTNCTATDNHTGACKITNASNETVYFYEIQSDLGLSSTGSYKGFVAIKPGKGTNTKTVIYVGLYDNNYITVDESVTPNKYYINYTENGEPKTDGTVTASKIAAVSTHASAVTGVYVGKTATGIA